jgi:putative ABC transport system permease protein
MRQAPGRAVTTVLSIGAGVALAVSMTILIASVDRSLSDFGRGLAGPAPLRLTGATLRGGLPEEAVARAAEVDGVAAVVPMVQTVARTQAAPGRSVDPALVLGVDCRIEALLGPIGCDPGALATLPGALAVGPELRGGPDAILRTDLGALPLGGAPVAASLADIGDGRAVVLPLTVAQAQFLRAGQVDVAYLLLDDGADVAAVAADVRRAVGPQLPVRGATDPPAGADAIFGAALPIYGMLGLFALGIGGVLVANTAAMALDGRRRELAVLGALGGRPRTVITTTVAEMAVLGLLGGIVGCLGGVLVATPIVASFSSFTETTIGATLSVWVPPSAVAIGLLLGAVLGGGAAVLPARRATRQDVVAELAGREAADATSTPRLGRRSAIWAAVAAVGATGCWLAQRDGGLAAWQAAVVTPAFLVTTIAALFATGSLAPLLVGRVAPLAARSASATTLLAVTAARRDHRRTGLLAVTLGAAVVTAFVTEGSSASARASIEASFARLGEGVDVSTVPFDDATAPAISHELADALAAVPGVAEIHRGALVVTGMAGTPVVVFAVSDDPLESDVIDGEASAARLAAGEVLIGPGLARAEGLRAGDAVALVTPEGSVSLPVQGVWEDGANVGQNVTMSPELLEDIFGPQPVSFVGLEPEAGVTAAQLAGRVLDAGLHPELKTRPSSAVADAIADEVDQQFASFRVMQQALLAVLFAAVLSSLLLAASQRRRELGLLAAVGADPPSLARLLLVETGLVGAIGLALAVVVGPLMMFALNQALPFVVGFRNPLTFAWPALVRAGAVSLVVALAGALWPARRAARVEVLEALRYE